MLTSIVALQLVAAPARADETEDAAQVHLDRGVDAFHAGEYARAHREFEAAQELAPDRANPYRWLALTEVQLNDCPRALGNIEEFLARVKPDDERIAELLRLREMCRRVAAEPTPQPARAEPTPITHRWWFWTAIAGAAVTITGVTIAVTAGGDDGPSALLPITCDATGCRAAFR